MPSTQAIIFMPLKDKEALKEYNKLYRRAARKKDPQRWRDYKNKWRNTTGELKKQSEGRKECQQWYVIKLYMSQTGLTRDEVLKNHMNEIRAKQLILKIKKAIKHEKNRNHQRTH